jgi:Fe-S-cluster-containing dehydrogenase component
MDRRVKEGTMARYGMLIEVDRCVGCYSCQLACRDEHAGNEHRPTAAAQPDGSPSWIQIRPVEQGSFPRVRLDYVAVPCLQCADAPCLAAAPEALYRRADGIVVIDPDKAIGRRDIVSSCPYGAIVWNEERQLAQKCTFCAHLLDEGWKEPRCVEACPTQTLVFGDLADPDSVLSQRRAVRKLEELPTDVPTKPAVVYAGLPSPFVAGEIAFGDRLAEPAAAVAIRLQSGSRTIESATDIFGDFEFEHLETDGDYVLTIAHPGYKRHERSLRAGTDCNIGTIVLEPVR